MGRHSHDTLVFFSPLRWEDSYRVSSFAREFRVLLREHAKWRIDFCPPRECGRPLRRLPLPPAPRFRLFLTAHILFGKRMESPFSPLLKASLFSPLFLSEGHRERTSLIIAKGLPSDSPPPPPPDDSHEFSLRIGSRWRRSVFSSAFSCARQPFSGRGEETDSFSPLVWIRGVLRPLSAAFF